MRSSPAHAERIEFNGKSQTVPQWAAELGIHPNTLRSRLTRGLSLDEALTPDVRQRDRAVAKMSKASGVSIWTIYNRMKRGLSLEEAAAIGKVHTPNDHDRAVTSLSLGKSWGMSRQAVTQIGDAATAKLLRETIAQRVIAWEQHSGERLSLDEAADVVVTVASDKWLRHQVFEGKVDVATLCRARIAQRRAESGQVSA